jgi:hypothetical protein
MTNRISDPRPVCADCGRTLPFHEFLGLEKLRFARCLACKAAQTRSLAVKRSPTAEARVMLVPLGKRWTTSVPTESGWYRWRRDGKSSIECVLVDAQAARAWRCGDPTVYRLEAHNGEPALHGEWWPVLGLERC